MMRTAQRHPAWRQLDVALFLFFVLAASAGAKSPPAPEVLTLDEAAHLLRMGANELEGLARRNEVPARRIAEEWRFSRQALLAWLSGDWTLIEAAVPTSPRSPIPNAPVATEINVAKAQTEPSREEEASVEELKDKEEPIGNAPEERTAEEIFLRGRKVLLARGEVSLDSGLFYSKVTTQQVAATVEQRTFTALLQGRVGVGDETELFASTTFIDQEIDTFGGSQKNAHLSRTEFGDVHLGVRRTLLNEGPGVPDIIATLDGRIPTGDTSFAVGGGLAFVKSVDPVVLFASANYRHTFSRDFEDLTRQEPEDRVDVTVGYALALNDTLTLSTSVAGVFTTGFRASELRDQDFFSLQISLTSWLAKGLYIEPSISFLLDGPADSFVLGLVVPYTF